MIWKKTNIDNPGNELAELSTKEKRKLRSDLIKLLVRVDEEIEN